MPKEKKYELIWTEAAKKSLKHIHPEYKDRIEKALSQYITWLETGEGKPPDIKRLRSMHGLLRLRVGKVRVLLRHNPMEMVITIIDVDNRGDVYKKK